MHVLPPLEVADLDFVHGDSNREVIEATGGHLPVLPALEVRVLHNFADALQNGVDELHVEARGEEGVK